MKKIFIILLLSFFIFSGCYKKVIQDDESKDIIEINLSESKTYSSMSTLIEDVKPSVVDIYSYSTNGTSAGSGVIIGKSNESYYVITNHHVIEGASTFEIVTYNNEKSNVTYDGILMGTSRKKDIAVLEIETTDELKIANVINDSDNVRIGTEVIAVGNPLGILGGSVTHGIISATKREVYISDLGYMDLFQTDAAINSGNSGGALFNYEGLLIGIVNSGYTNYEGLNFAIPSNVAIECFESIIKTKTNTLMGYLVGEADLGITLSEGYIYKDSSLSSQINTIYVSDIEINSDAAQANILDYKSFVNGKNNVFYALKKINGKEITSLSETIKILDNIISGEDVEFEFIEVSYIRTSSFFGQTAIYMTNNVITKTITPSQYIYKIN